VTRGHALLTRDMTRSSQKQHVCNVFQPHPDVNS
jgi:hypothetical protein